MEKKQHPSLCFYKEKKILKNIKTFWGGGGYARIFVFRGGLGT
jgi:hypothetical protein